MSENRSAASFGVGIFIGAAIGFATGIICAPSSGREIRTTVKEKMEQAEERAEEVLNEARKRARRIIEDAKGTSQREIEGEDME